MIRLKEIKIAAFLMAYLLLIACQEGSEPQSLTPQLFVNEVQVLNSDKFFLSGSYDPYGTETVTTATFYYGTTEAMEQSITARLTGRTATAILEGLQAGTTYYYCLEIGNGADSRRSDVRQFTTEGQKQVSALKNATLISAVEAQLSRSFQKEADGTVLLDNAYNQRLVEMVTWLEITDTNDPTLCDEIGYFTSLQTLACSRNDIETLDLSKNTALKDLWCEGKDVIVVNEVGDEEWRGKSGELMNLYLPQTSTLQYVHISGHMLTSIDVSGCPNLEVLDCPFGALVELDLTHNVNLKELYCEGNLLTRLNFSNNTELTHLQCQGNYLTDLDLTKLPKLVNVECGGSNLITELDLSKNPVLEELGCSNLPLTSIDLSELPELKHADFNVNQLTKLDLSHNPKLERLNCQYGPLRELDISHNPMLAYLECHGCQLTSLDLSNNHKIIWLKCHENQMTELDVSMITDNADILAGNQHTDGGVPISLTLYVNQAQYNRDPGTGPYYMDKYNEFQQDRVTVVLKQ